MLYLLLCDKTMYMPCTVFTELVSNFVPIAIETFGVFGPEAASFFGELGGGSELRPESLGHCSSCCRESRWQCSEAMRLQYSAQHPPLTMCMFKFCCRDNSAISTVIIHCIYLSLYVLFFITIIIIYIYIYVCMYIFYTSKNTVLSE